MTDPSDTPLDRSAATERLTRHATGASLTLDEYARCATAIEQAATAQELDAATTVLAAEPPEPPPASPVRWLVGVLGGTEQRGRWRLGRHLVIVAVFGGVSADLGTAEVESPVSHITVFALFGGAELRAPPGVPVQLSGLSLLGGKSDEREPGPSLPGAPLVHVRAFAILGGVSVKDRTPRPGVAQAVRSRMRRSQPPTAA